MINLLPTHERKALRKTYLLRLSVVSLALIIVVILLGVVMLVPSYLLLSERAKTLAIEEELLTSNKTYRENEQLNAVIQNTLTDLEVFQDTETKIIISNEVIEPVLANTRDDISIQSISFSQTSQSEDTETQNLQTITLTGVALTREGLLSFSQTLESVPTFIEAQIPIGSFIRQTDIPFTATIIFDPSPLVAS